MLRKYLNRSLAFVVITLYMLVMFGEGHAADLDVTLVVNPKSTEIYAGSGNVVITVDATGENLTFTWKLRGPGKLEGEGAAAFYSPPEKIDQKSASAVITVTVKEQSGQETVKSVAFTILPSPVKPAPPSPEPTPTKKKGMSKGTKVALGMGAAAALGGGIALLAGGDDSEPTSPCVTECAGVMVGCYCWYLSNEYESCTDVCASHGGYHEATRTYAGSDGTDSNCWRVLEALNAPTPDLKGPTAGSGLGCTSGLYRDDRGMHIWWLRFKPYTDPDERTPDEVHRACACAR